VVVPLIRTEAPGSVSCVSEAVTVPVIVLVWAMDDRAIPNEINMKNANLNTREFLRSV
jgi:hypothetical protein